MKNYYIGHSVMDPRPWYTASFFFGEFPRIINVGNKSALISLQDFELEASAKYRTDGLECYFVPFVTGMHWSFGQFGKTHSSCIGH